MKRQFLSTVLIAPLVAGCGLIETTEYIEVPGSTSAGAAPPALFAAQYTGDVEKVHDALFGAGVPGFISGPDGEVHEIRVRVDESTRTAYISIDGEERVFANNTFFNNGENYISVHSNIDSLNTASATWYGGDVAGIALREDGPMSRGYFGLETHADALPEGVATYNGNIGLSGGSDTHGAGVDGDVTIALNFDSNAVVGLFSGEAYIGDYESEEPEYGNVAGTIAGTIANSRFAADATFSGMLSGDIDMMGAVYGESGGTLAGAMGGTLSSEVGDMTMHGRFELDASTGGDFERDL